MVVGVAERRLRCRDAGAVEVRHWPQQAELLHGRPVQGGRERIGDQPVERIRHGGVQRRTTHRPVLWIQRGQGRDRDEQVRAAAAGVVGLDDRAPADLALDGHVPGMVLRVAVVAGQNGAGIQADEGAVAERSAWRQQHAVGIGVGERRVARGVGVEREGGGGVDVEPAAGMAEDRGAAEREEQPVAAADGRLGIEGVSEADARLHVVHVRVERRAPVARRRT